MLKIPYSKALTPSRMLSTRIVSPGQTSATTPVTT